jgi:hypothetical protein
LHGVTNRASSSRRPLTVVKQGTGTTVEALHV